MTYYKSAVIRQKWVKSLKRVSAKSEHSGRAVSSYDPGEKVVRSEVVAQSRRIKSKIAPPAPARYDWMDEAACAGSSTELFFVAPGKEQYAKSICSSCPVVRQCLLTALADPHLEGVWGNTTKTERDDMRRARKAAS